MSIPWRPPCGTFHFHYAPNRARRLRRVRVAVEAARLGQVFGGSPTPTPTEGGTIAVEPPTPTRS